MRTAHQIGLSSHTCKWQSNAFRNIISTEVRMADIIDNKTSV